MVNRIKRIKRELTKKFHPDIPGGSTEAMAAINLYTEMLEDVIETSPDEKYRKALNKERDMKESLQKQVVELHLRNLKLTEMLLNQRHTAKQPHQRLNILGWTVAKSGRYYRAFKKIDGKLHGVHIGVNLDDADKKIKKKETTFQNKTS